MPIKIELEGIDGCGKTTSVHWLFEELTRKGYKCLIMSEAGFSRIEACVQMRKIALDRYSDVGQLTMELLFAAQRVENDRWLKSKEAQTYDIVISDRGFLSHLAYGYAALHSDTINMLFCDILSDIRKPDYILYFDIETETAAKRINTRSGVTDKIEQLGVEYQTQVKAHFETVVSNPPLIHKDIISRIDANLNYDGVARQLAEWMNEHF